MTLDCDEGVKEEYLRKLQAERDRIRTELIDWLISDPAINSAVINGRRIVTEIDRICPKE